MTDQPTAADNLPTLSAVPTLPHIKVVVWFCLIAIGGYALFSVWVFGWSNDAALRGDIVGTWKSFAVLAFGFWIGSSSAGKMAAAPAPVDPSTGAQIPTPVRVMNARRDPVPTAPAEPEAQEPTLVGAASPDNPMEP